MNNLFSSPESQAATSIQEAVPSYLLAADNHNLGNTLGGSWFDPQTWSTKFDNAGKFIASSVISGASGLYNSVATVGNWLGAEAELIDTKSALTELFDDEMGRYYEQNREAADLVGFIASSFIPGLGGIKILNAGQAVLKGALATGKIGGNLASATRLLVPETENYILKSSQTILQSTATFNSINTNTLKALGAGVHKNVLEAAAFETAVQASMFKSPILDQQDGYDIAKNIALGGVIGGTIGGAIEAARTFGGIKKLVLAGNPEAKTFSGRATLAETTPADQRLILLAEDRSARITPEEFAAQNPKANTETNKKLYDSRKERINNEIRATVHSITARGDTELGNLVTDSVYALDHVQMFNNFFGAQEIGRLSTPLKVEQELKKAIKSLDIEGAADKEIRYVKLHGEGAGTVMDTEPVLFNLADKVSIKGKSTVEAVKEVVRNYKFKLDDNWSASALSGADAHLAAEARYIWASKVLGEVKPGTTINYDDFPLLERIYRDKNFNVKIRMRDGSVESNITEQSLLDLMIAEKQNVAMDLLEKQVLTGKTQIEVGVPEIAKIVNATEGALDKSAKIADSVEDYFARQLAQKNYAAQLEKSGIKRQPQDVADLDFVPSIAKISYDTAKIKEINGNVVNGLVWAKEQQKLYQQAADRAFAAHAGEIAENAPTISDNVLLNANVYGGGAGLFSNANGGYGTLASFAQNIGSNVTRKLKEKFRKDTAIQFEGTLTRLGSKQEAAIEFDVINNKIASTTEQYVPDVNGFSGTPNALISKKVNEYRLMLEENPEKAIAPILQKGAPEFIPVKNQETYDFIITHIQREDARVGAMKNVNAVLGHEDNKTLGIFRPVRPSPTDYPFVAFVKDDKVTGAGHTTMIHAASEKELMALAEKVPTDQGYRVIYKTQAEDYYKALNEYEYARTLSENYINSDLVSRGINSQFFTKTNPQKIVDGILQQHLRADDVLAAELVRMKYQPQFSWLEDQGKAYSMIESSQYGNTLTRAEKFGKNPYTDYIKTALDISKASEYPLLSSFNKALDTAVSKVVGNISRVFDDMKSPVDLDKINKMLADAGMNTAYQDTATVLLANHTAPKAELSKFIRNANSILSRFTLQLDPLNALNNAIGSNILRGTELKQLTRAISEGNASVAGELTKLMTINTPGVEGAVMLSPAKLIGNAIKNFFNDTDKVLLNQYKKEGLVKDLLEQFRSIQDDFTLKGTESVSELNGRINTAFAKAKKLASAGLDKGQQLTGNRFAEEFNRFISADVMRQLTDVAEREGILTAAESVAYRNTFVNRVEGNITASQRPIIFQGPIGQAVGLFQSYQFNLMQQLFRYIGEGTGKDAAMLLGLQGTFYGLNGMPAFNFINSHVVGTLSGNKNHTDLYDMTYGVAGKTVGDFLMYGIPSSIIQTNIYSRGDINPRHLTIIPNSIKDVPIVSAYGKLFGSLYETAQKIGAGGNVWQSILQGIEHNGISRPLAGLAQVAQSTSGNGQVFSTTNKGTLLYTNDLMSLATLSRLAGGRPLDEAIINDGVYRITAYEAAQRKKREQLIEAVKTTGIQGQQPDSASIEKFAAQYAATGGRLPQFNKWMMKEYVNANTPQSQKILQQLSSPFSQKMQILMGGRDPAAPASHSQFE